MTRRRLGHVTSCLLAVAGLVTPALAQEAPPPAAAFPPPPPVPADTPVLPPPPAADLPNRFWLHGEYLLWKVRDASLPPLVGTIPVEDAELIQQYPDSTITPLFGGPGSRLSYGGQSGVRLGAGLWFGDTGEFGLAAGYFQLGQGRQQAGFASNATTPLGPVFTDPGAGQEVLIMEAVPGLRAGTMTVQATNNLWGAEANGLYRLGPPGFLDSLDLIAGFRHLQFSEGLVLNGTSRAIPGGALPCG